MHVADQIERVEFDAAVAFSERLCVAADSHQVMRVPVMGVGVVWIQLEGALKCLIGAGPLPVSGSYSMR